jgi:hypothetical protein
MKLTKKGSGVFGGLDSTNVASTFPPKTPDPLCLPSGKEGLR